MEAPAALRIRVAPPITEGKASLRRILAPVYRVLFRVQVRGADRIPREGPCLLVFNHLSNFDGHLFLLLVPRDDATGLVASEYRGRPLERWLVEQAGGIWLRRGVGDRATLAQALHLLTSGWLVGLAPEGRRSFDGKLRRGKRGVALLALRSGAPVLPVGLTGTERAWRSWVRLRRPRVCVIVGAPLRFTPAPGGDFRSETLRVTDEIMRAIAALLPEGMRGAYAAAEVRGTPPSCPLQKVRP